MQKYNAYSSCEGKFVPPSLQNSSHLAAAEISELLVEDVEWALEDYNVCETDHYRIIDTE